MNDKDIEKITTLVKSGISVYWNNNGSYLKIISVIKEWVEFHNCIAEPAAYLDNGKFIALYSCDIDDFVTFNVKKVFNIY